MVISSGAFKAQENGRSYITDGIRLHTGPFIIRGGPVTLPPASITTEMLVPEAAEAAIGTYAQLVAWTNPTSGVWAETPVQVTLNFTGVRVRIEFNVLMSCPTKGQRIYYAMMVDGAPPNNIALGALDAPENGYVMMASGTYYYTPAQGTRRFAFGVNGPASSQIHNVIVSTLYVTEQRR